MIIFISGTNTNVGKTYITTKIAKLLVKKGFNVSIAKPIETGVETIPLDTTIYARIQNKCIDEICFYQFSLPSAPFIADKNNIIDINTLKMRIKALEKQCDILLVEGAGGLFVPIKQEYFMLDLIKDLDAFCIVVSDSRIGCISNIISARTILDSRYINFISVINIVENDNFMEISYPFIKLLDRNFIFQMQENELIDSIAYVGLKII